MALAGGDTHPGGVVHVVADRLLGRKRIKGQGMVLGKWAGRSVVELTGKAVWVK